MNQEIKMALANLNLAFQAVDDTGTPFEHFFCPILYEDQDRPLCKGHIIPKSLKTSEKWVVQTNDVDGFYGRVAECLFSQFVKGQSLSPAEILSNSVLSKAMNARVLIDSHSVEFYSARGNTSESHSKVRLEFGDKDVELMLKVTNNELEGNSQNAEFIVECDQIPAAVATLLKSAHLTMFYLLRYDYVFSGGGKDMASLLKQFYVENRYKDKTAILENLDSFFWKYRYMVNPVTTVSGENELRGTLFDGKMIAIERGDGKIFAFGIVVPIGVPGTDTCTINIVFVPVGGADEMGTFHRCFASEESSNKTIQGHLIRFCEGNSNASFHFEGDPSKRFFLNLPD